MTLRHVALISIALMPFQVVSAQEDPLTPPVDKAALGVNTPGISPDGKQIAFSYLGDLWTVSSTGGDAKRLTIHDAHDAYPKWSPDGKWIAFASNRYSTAGINYDIFVMPSSGGEARQITFHTANDYPMDWSPDGKSILFQSIRAEQHWSIYRVEVANGKLTTIMRDSMDLRYGVFSSDGRTVYFDRSGGSGIWWRPKYRGSANAEIYSKNLDTNKVSRVTDYEGMDLWPMAHPDGKRLFYASDQATPGKPNLVVSQIGSKPTALTRHDRPVRWPTMARNGSAISYTIDGELYVQPTSGGSPTKVLVMARSDSKVNRISRLNLTSGATELEVTPDGKTLLLGIRGQIWSLPADRGGDAVRLTLGSSRSHDYLASPDSSQVVYVNDRKGTSDIYVIDLKTKQERLLVGDESEETNPQWSPDGKRISFIRSGTQGGLYTIASDGTGAPSRVSESLGNNLFGTGISTYDWSPDGKWIAFSRRDAVESSDIWVAPATGGPAINVTLFPANSTRPRWTADGRYLVYASSRERTGGTDLWSIPLQPPREDESSNPSSGSDVKIDFKLIHLRAKRLTTQSIGGFELSPDGKSVIFVGSAGPAQEYFSISPGGGNPLRMTMSGDGTSTPRFGKDGGRFYAFTPGGGIKSVNRTPPGIWMSQPMAYAARMELDRRAELANVYTEFWRNLNAGFYDPKFHGVDWLGMKRLYEPLMSGVDAKEEFAFFFLSPMVGELNSSHIEISPAPGERGPVTGELGLVFDEAYSGPGLKVSGSLPEGPNDDGGLPRVKPGEFILSIDGEAVTFGESLYSTLLDKSGKQVELLVNSTAAKEGARTVKLKPIPVEQWRTLDERRQVNEARAAVDKLSGGKLAYIYLRDMSPESLNVFEQELWGQAREKEGLVFDVRGNRGGRIHDDVLRQLHRVNYAFTQPRDGQRQTQPSKLWDKPIVMIIDQNSVSDAEILPNGFRELKLGTILGMPTPGYVIGTYSINLQDGTGYRIPMWGFYDKNGRNMENNGVKPDVMVEHTPEDIATGRDRQLETAVDLLKKKLALR